MARKRKTAGEMFEALEVRSADGGSIPFEPSVFQVALVGHGPESSGRTTLSLTGECSGTCDAEAHGLFGEDAPAKAPGALPTCDPHVFDELTRMVSDAGGCCVLYRKPPAVEVGVYEEVRRLLLAVPGARGVRGLPAYAFDREAEAVLAEVAGGFRR